MKRNRFSYGGGREINLDGKPFIIIQRYNDESPFVTDQFARIIVKLLNGSAFVRRYLKLSNLQRLNLTEEIEEMAPVK